jgi:hypothetical protein
MTLDGAVAQYRALFAAEPPLGFDKWCASLFPRRASERPIVVAAGLV